MSEQLRISEIFHTFDGEVNWLGQGTSSVFVRLAGCHLRCPWCDAPESLTGSGHPMMTFEDILFNILMIGRGCRKVTVTGGEPLLQRNCFQFLELLVEEGYSVSVETSGTIPVPERFAEFDRLGFVVDYKLLYEDQFVPLPFDRTIDWYKFVVETDGELKRALRAINHLREKHGKLLSRCAVSPVIDEHGQFALAPYRIHEALTESGLHDVVVNLQIHKWASMR